MAGLARLGLCPPFYAQFENGLVYGFTFREGLYSRQKWGCAYIAQLIAVKLAKWHMVDLPGDQSPQLFITLNKYFRDIPKTFDHPDRNKNSLRSNLI